MKTQVSGTPCACDLCGGDTAFEVPCARLYTGGQPLHVCAACGLVYVRHRRSAEEIARTWSEEIFGTGYTARIPAVTARFAYLADFTDIHLGLEGKKACDIGAGEGLFLKLLRDAYGADVFGIEPSPHNCRMLDEMRIPRFQGTIEEFVRTGRADERGADLVMMLWTLECCRSPRAMLQAAWDLLPEDGHILVGTGSRILVPFKKPLQLYLPTHALDTHPVRFSANTLRAMFAACGFETVYVNRYIDTDYLCMIGRKRAKGVSLPWTGDDPVLALDFFERWHKDSLWYRAVVDGH